MVGNELTVAINKVTRNRNIHFEMALSISNRIRTTSVQLGGDQSMFQDWVQMTTGKEMGLSMALIC